MSSDRPHSAHVVLASVISNGKIKSQCLVNRLVAPSMLSRWGFLMTDGARSLMNELFCHDEHRGSAAVLHDGHTFRNRAPHVRDVAEHPPEAVRFFQMPQLRVGRTRT